MSAVFEFETRTCTCGREWEALTFWDRDAVCDTCATRAYEESLEEINAAKPYRVDSIGGMCPTQAEGKWIDGRFFYFRARHGTWTLRTDETNAVLGELVASGDDPTHGSLNVDEVLAEHAPCSTCGGTGMVDWAPGQQRDTEADQQRCPDCAEPAPTEGGAR